ncbi:MULTISPECIES: glutamate-1-semialdehyde 2,1-aminomutase [Pseudobutyrivibrio]|uniref:Glutamate-1-semialdehyde 2,1-aminomutase n=1 Tax=Pseudobutyrivibrio xylanivorans TaxID=185007 RepID=A0A1G5RSP4_PSEXY|nr:MULTISPECIES: glutamate-1-semialdehyde 2,1-aminomutase [Pseudobutyrivibrio]SCZ77115.1 glutamate-1-semialdehyde 2,1-aminomutase [Pseudobutyrivibrio xylanivorans]SFN65096.1 glutamate-1-semialdehyde 2,1-aminomutase [Pseudobutyrivibrio sp. UC1225]
MSVSHDFFEDAKQHIPGGVNSPVRAFRAVGQDPLFIDHAKGSHIFDVDGNEYVDYVCSWGPMILGHAYQPVIDAVKAACDNGLSYGAPTQKETVLAKLILEAVPFMDKVRLVNSGTEAVMSAIRVARGYTGKDKIIKFRGNYHGHSDGLLVTAGSGLLTESTPDSAGVPKGYTQTTLLANYNDEASVEALFKANKGEIAAVIVEPVSANMGVVPPKEGFLEFLRKITKDNEALLIFDEVITGFRLAFGGASEYFGIQPDMITFGKIVGGGMPLAAYVGKKDIMDMVAPVGAVYQAGTLSGNPIAVTAGIESLKVLKADKDIYKRIDAFASKLEEAYKKKGISVNRVGSLLSPFFTDGSVESYADVLKCDTEKFAQYFRGMVAEGIYVAPSQFEAMFISDAHTEEDLEKTLSAIDKVL